MESFRCTDSHGIQAATHPYVHICQAKKNMIIGRKQKKQTLSHWVKLKNMKGMIKKILRQDFNLRQICWLTLSDVV